MKKNGSWVDGKSFLFYLVLGVLAFFPCLFLGQTFFDGDLLNSNHPARTFLRDFLLHGHFPLWDPFLFGGQPFLGDGDFMACYPFLYPTLLFPVEYGFAVFYLSCFLIAALGMHFWLKGLDLSEQACRLGSVLFVLSGYFWWEIIHPPVLAALVWVPWWAGALERVSREPSPARGFAAGLFFAFLFMAGNFQITLGALYGGIVYLTVLLLLRKPRPRKGLSRWALTALAFAWGALPLLAFWIPAWEFMSRCGRLLEAKDYATFLADLSLEPSKIWRFLLPAITVPGTHSGTAADSFANAGYWGPWALFFGVLAFWRSKDRSVPFLGAAALLALGLACGKYLSLHRWFCDWVPGFGLARAPFRYVFLYGTALSVLASAGFDGFREEIEKKASWYRWLPLVFAVLVFGFAWGGDVLSWIQVLGALGGGLVLWSMAGSRRRERWTWIFLLVVAAIGVVTAPFIRTSRLGPSSNFQWKDRCPMLFKLPARTGLARTFLGDGIPYPVMSQQGPVTMFLPADAAMVAGLRNDSGYNPLCLKSVSDLFSLPAGTHVKLMAVKSYVTGTPSGLKDFRCEDWEGVHYCENTAPISFVYAPRRVQTVSSSEDRLALMRRPDYDPYQAAFLSEPVSLFRTKEEAGLTYDLEQQTTDEETFRVSLKRPGYAVFSEVMFPGWKAAVDGKETRLFTANHAFRALWLDAGEHRVEFRYEPVWVWPILVGLVLWVLSLGLWGWPLFRKRACSV